MSISPANRTPTPVPWPSDLRQDHSLQNEEDNSKKPACDKPEPRLKDGGLNYVW